MKAFTLYHTNPNIETLEEFCISQGIHFDSDKSKREDKYQLKDFFNDNRERILVQMSDREKREFITQKGLKKQVSKLEASDLTIDMKIPCPMKLVINNRLVSYTLSAKHSTFQEMVTDITAFEDEQIRGSMLQDAILFKSIRRKNPKCSVIGFFKTLYYAKKDGFDSGNSISDIYQMKSNFTNISKFVTNVNTSVNAQGGSFSIQLAHVPFYHKYEMDKHATSMGSDNFKGDALSDFMDLSSFEEMYNFSDKSSNYPVVKADIDTMDYWIWLISTNDLIFISFDDIDNIQDDGIAGNSFDMIGLVESVSLSRDSNGNITVNVSGRDLMKLLSDDSSLFFPCATVVNKGNFFDNTEGALRTGDIAGVGTVNGQSRDKVDKKMMRMPGPSGMVRLFRQECNGFTIDYIIKVVISALANVQICPSEIFSSWGDRVTTFEYLTPSEDKNSQTDKNK